MLSPLLTFELSNKEQRVKVLDHSFRWYWMKYKLIKMKYNWVQMRCNRVQPNSTNSEQCLIIWDKINDKNKECWTIYIVSLFKVTRNLRNNFLSLTLFAPNFFQLELQQNDDNQETDNLEVTLLRASNFQIFRNINNNKTCSNPER